MSQRDTIAKDRRRYQCEIENEPQTEWIFNFLDDVIYTHVLYSRAIIIGYMQNETLGDINNIQSVTQIYGE